MWEPYPFSPPRLRWSLRRRPKPPPHPDPGPLEQGPGRPRGLVLGILVSVGAMLAPLAIPLLRDAVGLLDLCDKAEGILEEAKPLGAPSSRSVEDSLLLSPGEGWVMDANFSEDLDLASQFHGDAENRRDWRAALAENRFRRGWKRLWLLGGNKFLTDNFLQEVLEFETAAEARRFQRWAIAYTCRAAEDIFAVPDLPGAVGAQFTFEPEGRVADNVSFVIGNRRFAVVLGAARGSPDRGQLFGLMRAAVSMASAAGDPCADPEGLIEKALRWGDRSSPHPIWDLRRLLPSQPPAGFRLDPRGSLEGGLSMSPTSERHPHFRRTWSDGVAWIAESVFQFPDPDAARRWLQQTAERWCAEAATVSTVEVIPGSVLIFNQGPDLLSQLVYFIRGSRGYQIDFFGPAGQTPAETLRVIAQRASVAAQ